MTDTFKINNFICSMNESCGQSMEQRMTKCNQINNLLVKNYVNANKCMHGNR